MNITCELIVFEDDTTKWIKLKWISYIDWLAVCQKIETMTSEVMSTQITSKPDDNKKEMINIEQKR